MYGQRYEWRNKQRLKVMPMEVYLMRDWESGRP